MKIKIKMVGEVSNMILEDRSSCGNIKDGVSLEIERYRNRYSDFSSRGGVLSNNQMRKIIKFFEKAMINNPQAKEDKQSITRSTLPRLEKNHTKLNSMRTAQQPVDAQKDGRLVQASQLGKSSVNAESPTISKGCGKLMYLTKVGDVLCGIACPRCYKKHYCPSCQKKEKK